MDASFELIARSGTTTVPGTTGTFNGFGAAPAIDEDGNVVFTGGGGGRAGVYTALGFCCQIVADTQTLIPGGGANFYDFSGDERHDIDGGRVAFTVMSTPFQSDLYSNVGQASPTTLRRIAAEDGIAWDELGDPWVDGDTVAVYGVRPSQEYAILQWDGPTQATSLLDPGAGFNVAFDSQASISGDAAVFLRYNSNAYQVAVRMGSTYEALATADVTPMPDMNDILRNFYHHPVVDRDGLDIAFLGYGAFQGLFKRVDGGVLQHVADNSMLVPGSAFEQITLIDETGIALADGQVVFQAYTSFLETGIYTDAGGELATLLDTGGNDTIVIDGQSLRVSGLSLGTRGFAYGPDGYMVVFRANLATGGSAIIRAVFGDGSGGGTDGTFTVRKDYSDNNTDAVTVTASCSSGTVTNNPQSAREGVPAVFQVTGAAAGTTCTAVETSVVTGYSKDESDCQDGDPLNGSCTLVNTLIPSEPTTFTVYKDFTDNNSAWVYIRLTCTSGTVTNSPRWAREITPAVFDITGATPGTTCTAEEISFPTGYAKDESDCQDGDPLGGSCTLVNAPASSDGTFTVFKDFSDDSTASVSVSASCSSGIVTNNPQLASEASPAVFDVTGVSGPTTCTAVENGTPAGYSKNETGCQDGDPLNGSCTIINTRITSSDTFTAYKDFSDNSTASVSVSASCSSGTVTNNPQLASEASPAVFAVSGATPGTTCTAVENNTPTGYAGNQADCQVARPLNGSCILVNTRIPTAQLQDVVYDGFEDGNANGWSTSGSVDVSSQTAIGQYALRLRKGSTAELAVSTAGYSGVSISMRLAGSSLESGELCFAEYSTNGGGTWTTLLQVDNGDPEGSFLQGTASPAAASNNSNLRLRFRSTGGQPNDYCWGDEVRLRGTASAGTAGSLVVRKDFSDNNASSVTVSLACTSGTVTNSPRSASEASPAIFYIQGHSAGATCSAFESVPSGYTANESGCQDGDPVNGACTIVNTLNQTSNGTFTVYKDFSDNNTATVTFTASCSSGTVTNSPRTATESSPAVFNVTDALPGSTCTAAEPTVPSGYTRNQTDCQNAKPLNGSCTIVNTLIAPPQEVDILYSTFEDGQAGGWSVGSNVTVDSAVAIGQYALHLQDDGAVSTRAISTAGYSSVTVSVRMAATDLQGSDSCLAEYSTNGGGTWSTLLELSNGGADGTFATGTTATASASNNPNFRLRFRMVGKGKGDHCYGDEIRVRGTP